MRQLVVHVPLEPEPAHPRVERPVALDEVDLGVVVAEASA